MVELLVRLMIAIVATVLVCTLNYFKNATNDAKKRNWQEKTESLRAQNLITEEKYQQAFSTK